MQSKTHIISNYKVRQRRENVERSKQEFADKKKRFFKSFQYLEIDYILQNLSKMELS